MSGNTNDFATGAGSGDMTQGTYDTNMDNLVDDADKVDGLHASQLLDRSNHTGTQTASTISDFDTEVSNNTDVAANTGARHTQNTDLKLDSGNLNEVTAADLRAHLDDTTTNPHNVTLSGSNLEQTVIQSFTYLDSSPLDFDSFVAGDEILDSEIEITTVFDDPAAALSLGTILQGANVILAISHIDPTVLGTYHNPINYTIGGADQGRLAINPGTSTQGAGRVVLTVRRI